MTQEAENQWLARAVATLDSPLDAPRAVFERLKFVAGMIESAGCRGPDGPALLYGVTGESPRYRALGGELTVGREQPSDLAIEAPSLSRRHFRVRVDGGRATLEDLGSRNGTFVNGRRTAVADLKDGDVIEAGGMVFVYLGAAPRL